MLTPDKSQGLLVLILAIIHVRFLNICIPMSHDKSTKNEGISFSAYYKSIFLEFFSKQWRGRKFVRKSWVIFFEQPFSISADVQKFYLLWRDYVQTSLQRFLPQLLPEGLKVDNLSTETCHLQNTGREFFRSLISLLS